MNLQKCDLLTNPKRILRFLIAAILVMLLLFSLQRYESENTFLGHFRLGFVAFGSEFSDEFDDLSQWTVINGNKWWITDNALYGGPYDGTTYVQNNASLSSAPPAIGHVLDFTPKNWRFALLEQTNVPFFIFKANGTLLNGAHEIQLSTATIQIRRHNGDQIYQHVVPGSVQWWTVEILDQYPLKYNYTIKVSYQNGTQFFIDDANYTYNVPGYDRVQFNSSTGTTYPHKLDHVLITDIPFTTFNSSILFSPDVFMTNSTNIGVNYYINADDFIGTSPDNLGVIVSYSKWSETYNTTYGNGWFSGTYSPENFMYFEEYGTWRQTFFNPYNTNLENYIFSHDLKNQKLSISAVLVSGLNCASGICYYQNVVASDHIIYDPSYMTPSYNPYPSNNSNSTIPSPNSTPPGVVPTSIPTPVGAGNYSVPNSTGSGNYTYNGSGFDNVSVGIDSVNGTFASYNYSNATDFGNQISPSVFDNMPPKIISYVGFIISAICLRYFIKERESK